MPKAPPLLPEETLHRVLRVARFDGLSMTLIAGLFALISAVNKDVTGAIGGLLVAGAGAMELHGFSLMNGGARGGTRWLIGSQFFALCVIVGYAVWRLGHPDPLLLEAFRLSVKDEQRQVLREVGWTEDEFIRLGARMVYGGLVLLTLIYQGGMMIYYGRRQAAVEQAVEQAPESAPDPE
jgi:hypothetical protein